MGIQEKSPEFSLFCDWFFWVSHGRRRIFRVFSFYNSIFSADTNFFATLNRLTEESQKRLRYEPEGIEGQFGRDSEAGRPLQNPCWAHLGHVCQCRSAKMREAERDA